MKKYELTTDTKMVLGRKLFRIKALVSFGNVKIGDLGGYIEKEENLSQEGNAWVSGNAKVSGNADYATAQGFGSVYRVTTFFREKTGEVGVKCGCFYGTLAEFRKKVKETHGDSKKAKEYLMLADLMEYRFSDDE